MAISVLVAALVAILGAAVLTWAHLNGIPMFDLLRDPASQFGIPVYAALVSYVGISVLFMAGGILGFAALFAPAVRGRFAMAAALTLLLAVDDQYMLHEFVGPEIVGLPELAFYGCYAILVTLILTDIGSGALSIRHLGLWLALLGFAATMGIDLVLPINAWSLPIEDLTKLGAFTMWLCYWGLAAARAFGAAAGADPRGHAARGPADSGR